MCYDLVREHQLTSPVIQAPMAGTSTAALAAAVAEAGGMGSTAIGALAAESAAAEIDKLQSLTHRPTNVNVFCHRPALSDPAVEKKWLAALSPVFQSLGAHPPESLREPYSSFVGDAAMLDVLLDRRPAVVSFHFGLPGSATIRALKRSGIRLWSTATTLSAARYGAEAGVDAIVAQGHEAGGHRGVFDPDAVDPQLGTFALVRLLSRTIDLPIIAAGGIMDGAGIAAALRLGAVAAQLGTAFIACPESAADEAYRARLLSESAYRTFVTRHISGRPARCLSNGFTALAATLKDVEVPAYPIAYAAGKALNAAANQAGNHDFGAHWAGQGAPLARVMPAAELMATFRAELEHAMRAP